MATLADVIQFITREGLSANDPHLPAFTVVYPASGEIIAHVPDQDPRYAKTLIEQAVSAFAQWRTTTAYQRATILRQWHALVMQHEQTIGELISAEMGKPVTEARGEVRYAAGFIEWYAEEAKRIYGQGLPSAAAHKRLWVIQQPVGVVYGVTPWNFPAAMVTRKVAPALAAGCTFILKPAEQSPLTAILLAKLWEQAGGPTGSFQVLTASDPVPVTRVMMDDPRVRKLTFTGSTAVGKLLYAQAAPTMKRLSLELGGHAPYLVFEDADLDQAVKEVVACKFRNAGQTCVCTNRVYVQASIQPAFTQRLAATAAALHLGDPLATDTQIGPLVDAQGLAKVQQHIADAVGHGAHLVTGGHVHDGLYFQPTVLTNVQPQMLIMHEETFGPVVPIISFATELEAIQLANDTTFGLAAYLYTRDIDRAIRVAEALEYGIVGINDGVPSTPQAPFGGVKSSGLGREGGAWGIQEYLDIKFISLAMQSAPS